MKAESKDLTMTKPAEKKSLNLLIESTFYQSIQASKEPLQWEKKVICYLLVTGIFLVCENILVTLAIYLLVRII